jgi:hypothetical protein
MVRRRTSEAQIWQIIGMNTTASFKAIGCQIGYDYTVVSRLVRKSVYQQWTFNDSPWIMFRWFQTVSNCSCRQTSIGQPVMFEYGTGCEWHPSKQTLQCPVVTIRCYPWSDGSWQVFPIIGLCVFSHQSADYRIVVGLESKRVITRSLLVDRYRRSRLAWCLARRGWNLRTWRNIH